MGKAVCFVSFLFSPFFFFFFFCLLLLISSCGGMGGEGGFIIFSLRVCFFFSYDICN